MSLHVGVMKPRACSFNDRRRAACDQVAALHVRFLVTMSRPEVLFSGRYDLKPSIYIGNI